MDDMTSEMAFRTRELSESGLWSGRIAELLDVDERLVRRAIAGEIFEDEPPPRPGADMPARPARPKPVDRDAWPPPVDESTEWASVSLSRGYAQKPTSVHVRSVQLWGKRVQIRANGDVWCTWCGGTFHTVAKLGAPGNGCPTGLIRKGVRPICFDPDDPSYEPEPRYRPAGGAGGSVDLMRVPW